MFHLLTSLGYLTGLVCVGMWRARSAHSHDDFLVAGRRLPTVVLVGTLLATWIGAGSILAGAGLAYRYGFAALWLSAGAWVAIGLLFLIAARARAMAHYTVPELLETRYGPAARVLGAVVTVVAYTAVVSYQYRGGGLVLNLVTGLDPETGVILTAAFVIAYTAIAGLVSVAYTDVVNGAVLLGGVAAALVWLVGDGGGIGTVLAELPAEKTSVLGTLSVPGVLGLALPPLVLLLGEGTLYQRFFSARDERTARRAVAGWILGTIAAETLIVALAVVGSTRIPGLDEAGAPGAETIVLRIVTDLLPRGLGALLLAAVVAIIVSTGSFLLVPATNLVRDVYGRFLAPGLAPERAVRLLRLTVVLLGVAAWAQLRYFESVLQMALYAYTMYGAGVTPAVLAAFFWKRATPAGGVASLAVGMAMTLLWEVLKRADRVPAALAAWDTVFFALAGSIAALVVVSLATPPPDPARWRPFFESTRPFPSRQET
ncbi:MAG: sodium:solute symporter family protein [Gemmatimonadetes bacterium]|nr:sodium:solute symporter family protein [Gemmatimonadota bacterium]